MVKKGDLISAVLDGIVNANDFYLKISNGFCISDSGVEGVLQTKIAEAIYDLLPKDSEGTLNKESIALEYPFKSIFEESEAGKLRGKVPQLVDGTKRVDILICDSKERPLVPIEIKRNAASEGFSVDASRILGVLKRSDTLSGGSVKFGLICGFVFGEGSSETDCIDHLDEKIGKSLVYLSKKLDLSECDFYVKKDKPKEFDGDAWWIGGAICVYLKRKN